VKLFVLLTVILFSPYSAIAAEKVDWQVCKADLEKNCSKKKSDHDKHECLEHAGKDKVSPECLEMNASLEDLFKEHHKGHKGGHKSHKGHKH
jgi:hypothetical protein